MSTQPCGCDYENNYYSPNCPFEHRPVVELPLETAAAPTPRPCKRGHVAGRDKQRRCRECRKLYDLSRYERHHDKEKKRALARSRKGLPEPTRPCPGHCELCGGPSGKRTFHLDHDHKTGAFRGWLCGRCNTSLGKFGDDVQGMLQALQYLQRTTANRPDLPTDAAERKQYPIATGFIDYFPKAIAAVAHVSWVGNEQHNPGQPLHWDRSKSKDEADAMMRHFRDRGTIDKDGTRHSAKCAWRAMAMLEKELEEANGKVG